MIAAKVRREIEASGQFTSFASCDKYFCVSIHVFQKCLIQTTLGGVSGLAVHIAQSKFKIAVMIRCYLKRHMIGFNYY